MKLVIALVMFLSWTPMAGASFSYNHEGRVIQEGFYLGPPVTPYDVAFLIVGYGGWQTVYSFFGTAGTALGSIVPVSSFITWGAWRTADLRPQAMKDMVTFNLNAQAAAPIPGSVAHVLE